MGMELTIELTDAELFSQISAALNSALQGNNKHYEDLCEIIRSNECAPDKVAGKVTALKALSGSVFSLDIIHHKFLVAHILEMSLWNYRTDVMDAVLEFIITLASSRGQYLDLCLEMLVRNFMPPHSFLLNRSDGILQKGQVSDRVHSTLFGIAKLVPLSPLRLEEIVKRRMPHIHEKEPLIVIYVENMLKLESGAIGNLVGRSMLLAFMDRLIELDVNIPWDEILHKEFTEDIFNMELKDLERPVDYCQQDGDEIRISRMEQHFGKNLIAQQLDSLMVLTFKHLNFCKENGRLSQVFDTLLQSFQLTVLPTYKSKFAQFVMFYACSLDPENCSRRFADTLLDIFKIGISPEQRMSAVAYLASFLARAKFLPISFVAEYVESLVEWCSTYCSNRSGGINPIAHKEFYAACQAMMYVLCFHMKSMLTIPGIRSRISKHIEYILRHPLSPLTVCLPSVVEEFLRLANMSDNFVSSGQLESELSMAFGGTERLDMFFPFDPCLLMISDRYIRPHFVYWSMVQSSHDDDDAAAAANNEMSEMLITPERVITQCVGGSMQMPSRLPPIPESL